MPPGTDARACREVVERWHERVLPQIGTKPFSVSWADFKRAWNSIKFEDDWTLEEMMANLPELPPLMATQEYGPEGEKLLRICVALQRKVGLEDLIFLSCRKAGEALGLSHQDASILLRSLVDDGWMTLVSKGSGLKASRYRVPLAAETSTGEQR